MVNKGDNIRGYPATIDRQIDDLGNNTGARWKI
jgi:hypothetical protein